MSMAVMATDRFYQPKADEGEQDLIRAAQGGELEAFNRLVVAYQDSLYRWVYHLVGDSAQAEDLVQTAFITAYQKLHTFRYGSFRSWLFQIARNQAYDELRRRQRHPSVSLDTRPGESEGQEPLEILEGDDPIPEELVERRERDRTVRQLLERLPAEAREVLVLVDMNDLDYGEAAAALHVPIGTVKSRLARARVRFRQVLQDSGFASAWLPA